MKISKHVHACLLVEENGKRLLIDPGNYTAEEKALDVAAISSLDYLLITHEHQDHFYLPLIKKVVAKFPAIQILTNASVAALLEKEGIKTVTQIEGITMQPAAHEQVFGMGKMCENVVFDIFGQLTHPGDSFQFSSTQEVLALPVQAPWGSLTQAVELAIKLKPKVIIPIHDWHWSDKARETFYSWLTNYFGQVGIEFKAVKTGETVEG